ncbi:non-ribosomal peptide synthetase, partial [Amycolatopsis rhizosphaerae]
MAPASYIILDRFPLTANGKLDTTALPEPGDVDTESTPTSPRTPTEEVIAGIWRQVLGIDRVGVHDNFFTLGGHSLLAAQIFTRLRAVFRVEVPLRALFEEPTIAALAARVERLRQVPEEVPPPSAASRPARLPLSSTQQRAWFFEHWEPDSPLHNIIAGFRMSGRLDVGKLADSFTAVVARHEALRTTFTVEDGEPWQVIGTAGSVDLPVVDLSRVPDQDDVVRRLATAEAARRFDLLRGPLLRPTLLRLAPEEHVLLISLHHIIADGVSMAVLLRELAHFYRGAADPLPELPFQYADYAVWEGAPERRPALDRQLEYWRAQLDGVPALLELPTDFPRPATRQFRGASHAFTVPDRLVDALRHTSSREGVTLFMTLLAAYTVLLSRHSGQHDIVVGTPVAHRPRPELENLIGYFATTLPLRTDLGDDPTFRRLLHRVRDTCLDAYAHQDIPFEQLVEQLTPVRDPGHTPLAQVGCDYQRVPEAVIEWPGVRLRPLEPAPGNGTSKVDLTLSFTESPAGLTGTFVYLTDLFTADTVERLTERYLTLLEGLVGAPSRRVGDNPLLTGSEQALLQAWNTT